MNKIDELIADTLVNTHITGERIKSARRDMYLCARMLGVVARKRVCSKALFRQALVAHTDAVRRYAAECSVVIGNDP